MSVCALERAETSEPSPSSARFARAAETSTDGVRASQATYSLPVGDRASRTVRIAALELFVSLSRSLLRRDHPLSSCRRAERLFLRARGACCELQD